MRYGFTDTRFEEAVGSISYNENKNRHSGTFTLNSKGIIELKIPRCLGTKSCTLKFYNEEGNLLREYSCSWCSILFSCDIYYVEVRPKKLGIGLYFYTVELETVYGKLFFHKCQERIKFKREEPYDRFQITISDFKYKKPNFSNVIYHIFVDRFNRGGDLPRKENGLYPMDWSTIPEYPEYPGAPLKNNTFYGGTLYGIIDKLDYIASLGVGAIYLSPIFDSPSNHKYDTSNYMSVDSSLGGDEALYNLIKEAEKRGIGIILDGVFNHTGDDSIYFNKYSRHKSIGAYQSRESEYYSWYDFLNYPENYKSWWDIDILPRINTEKEECRQFFIGCGGVIDKYAAMGISGFRLDVVDELSGELVEGIKERLNAHNNKSVLYGEVWEDASNKIAYGKRRRYYLGQQLDGVMNYPLRCGIINYLNNKNTSLLFYALYDIINNAPKRIRDLQMNLLGSHDTVRILSSLCDKDVSGLKNISLAVLRASGSEITHAVKKLKLAYLIAATVPGIPVIYYGDEAGLEGYGDPFNRMPYPWDNQNQDILSFYRLIGSIRQNNRVYSSGEYELIELSRDLLIFKRVCRNLSYVTVINNSDYPLKLTVSSGFEALLSGNRYKSGEKLELNALSGDIIKVKDNETIILDN